MQRWGGKTWTKVVTADSQGCQCCRLTALEFLWMCLCLKKHWKILLLWKIASKGHFSSVDYCKIRPKENTFFLWWIFVEVHPKKTEEAICMKMSKAMFQGLQYLQRRDVAKYNPPSILLLWETRLSSWFPASLLVLKICLCAAGGTTTIRSDTQIQTDACIHKSKQNQIYKQGHTGSS